MMAMAVFSLLALGMMGFFNSAQKIWSKSSQRGEMYADAHVALDLMARELQGVMYSNDDTSQSIYPFWFQKIRNVSDPNPAEPAYENMYYPKVNGSDIELTQLNFIAATDLKPQNAVSNICEIRYRFVPAGETIPATQSFEPTAANPKPIGEGWLVRSCTADKRNDSTNNPFLNFKDFPRRTTAGAAGNANRVSNIWLDASSDGYQKVIPNVYSLKFTCYNMDATGAWLDCKPMRYDVDPGTGTVTKFEFGTQGSVGIGSGLIGTPLPMAVKIDLAMMSPTDWREWKAAVDRDDIPGAERIKRERLRTFSKTVFLNNRFSD